LANAEHTDRPWRIHEIASDFDLEDVWALPTPGGPADFARLVKLIASSDPSRGSFGAARALWSLRAKIGDVLGWDGPASGVGSRVSSLGERLPADLRTARLGQPLGAVPFSWLYCAEDECAAELGNQTMHGVLHLGWVPDGSGRYRGQMAVLVKPNGLLGIAYMAAIRPFRHLIVYPAMIRQIERRWRAAAVVPAPRARSNGGLAQSADLR
jgi:hypothetical protein